MKTILGSFLAVGLLLGTAFAQEKGVINQREANEKARIKAGTKDGSLNTKEARRLKAREGSIEAQEARDRADGKGFTNREKAKIDRRQEKLSKDIYKQRHDDQVK